MSAPSPPGDGLDWKTLTEVKGSVDLVPSDEGESSGIIRGLRPLTVYLCSIQAENEVGLSIASHRIEVHTEEEGKRSEVKEKF